MPGNSQATITPPVASPITPQRARRRHPHRWLWAIPAVITALVATVLGLSMSHAPLGSLALALGTPPSAPDEARQPLGGRTVNGQYLFSPDELQRYYQVKPLLDRGDDGSGQTVVVIDSFGSPFLTQDLATFDAAYHLPKAQVQVMAPLGETTWDPKSDMMAAWSRETEEDVEVIHAFAPGASIVVLTSPVSQNQGTDGLAQFLQLERFAVDHRLGTVISQSWGASEASLDTPDGHTQVSQWDDFFDQATSLGVSFVASSGDHGVTDFADDKLDKLASSPTSNFPASDPEVLGVGGTVMNPTTPEQAWAKSGGGVSRFFAAPAFQARLAPAMSALLAGHRGVPDVSALGSRDDGLGIVVDGRWRVAYGTSASVPEWAALIAIADQMRGGPLGDLNPLLYQLAASPTYGADFDDITVGNNSWTTGPNVTGYDAAVGWDPITGLGTPRADRLLPDLVEAASHRPTVATGEA